MIFTFVVHLSFIVVVSNVYAINAIDCVHTNSSSHKRKRCHMKYTL